MAFDSLSEKLNHVFSKMREKGKLTDLEIKQAMREIRIALLEAEGILSTKCPKKPRAKIS